MNQVEKVKNSFSTKAARHVLLLCYHSTTNFNLKLFVPEEKSEYFRLDETEFEDEIKKRHLPLVIIDNGSGKRDKLPDIQVFGRKPERDST